MTVGAGPGFPVILVVVGQKKATSITSPCRKHAATCRILRCGCRLNPSRSRFHRPGRRRRCRPCNLPTGKAYGSVRALRQFGKKRRGQSSRTDRHCQGLFDGPRTANRGRKTPDCCRSSVVEHSLGKGEVESSIPSGSTRFSRFTSSAWDVLAASTRAYRKRSG